MMITHTLLAALVVLSFQKTKPLPPIELTAVVHAPIEKVWQAFTTTEGMRSWAVAQADIEMKLGAVWKTKYGKEGTLGDEGTIFNELLAFDPGRMYTIRIQKPPKGFPFMNVYRDMWTVVYFDPTENGKTKVTLRAHGFTDSEESQKMRAFFERGNKYTLGELVKHFSKTAERFEGLAVQVSDDGAIKVRRKDQAASTVTVKLAGIARIDGEVNRDARKRLCELVLAQQVRVQPISRGSDGAIFADVTASTAYFLYPELQSGSIAKILIKEGLANPLVK